MSPLVSLVGIFPIVGAGADVFLTLFHPSGSGPLARAIQRAVWRSVRPLARRRPGLLAVAGPGGVLLTIATWAALLVLGWALVYWPAVPDGFHFESGLDPDGSAIVTAVYVSTVTLATLGYGDISPLADWLRLVAPFESILGFGLLTASLSWLISIYPALHRRRQFARRLLAALSAYGDARTLVDRLSADGLQRLLYEAEEGVTSVSTDLEQNQATYYFRQDPRENALPRLLLSLLALGDAVAGAERCGDLEFRAQALERALEDLGDILRHRFLPHAGPGAEAVLRAYAADHLVKVTHGSASEAAPA